MIRFALFKTRLNNLRGKGVLMEHFVMNRILAVLLTVTCAFGASAANVPPTVESTAPEANVFYIFTDQINTAREITNASGVKVWQADPEPFGANLPIENPAGQGQFKYNQRFPGQYFDKETGLHYNYFRDYDPQSGRYVQSDPIGLNGGLNTFGYALGNPVANTDPQGLIVPAVLGVIAAGRVGYGAYRGHQVYRAARFYGSAAAVAYGAHKVAEPNRIAANDALICKPDDPCLESQKSLNVERNGLLDFVGETAASDVETRIAINNQIIAFNRKVVAHNKTCPHVPVMPLPLMPTGTYR